MKKLLALLLCFGLAFTTVATVQALEEDDPIVESGEGEDNPGEPTEGDEGEPTEGEDEYGVMPLGGLCEFGDCW